MLTTVSIWTGRLATALQEATRQSQEGFAANLGLSPRTVAKWREHPDAQLRATTSEILDTALARIDDHARQRFFSLTAASASATTMVRSPASSPSDWLMAAAMESSSDALLRSGHVGAHVFPDLVQHIMHIARSYDSESRLSAFRHAQATRDLAIRLADQTRRPSDLADLYVALGELNGLMASLAFDLGNWDAAAPMARAATAYAEMSGHASLHAWTIGLEATLAFWRGDGVTALARVDAGLSVAPRGAPRFRLLNIAARAHAVNGDLMGTCRVLEQSVVEREIAEGLRDELHDAVGGEFHFDDARASACAGAAWLQLRAGEAALQHTIRTLALYEADGGLTSPGVVNGARIDTAAALLMQGDLSDAERYLRPVLDLQPDPDNVSLGRRLETVVQLLDQPQWRDGTAAKALASTTSAWLSGGPGQSRSQ